MSTFTRLSLGRLIGETGVIVIGITLGLAADRWVSGIDEQRRVAAYISELVDNLQADSATLATAIRRAEQRQRFAVGLLDGGADSLLVDPAAFLQSLETLTWWSPLDHSRETWDDLVATGGLRLIRSPALRLALSRYYNTTEETATIEQAWVTQLLQASQFRLEVIPPILRLGVVGALPDGASGPPVTQADALSAVQAVRSDAPTTAEIANVAMIYWAQKRMYGDLLDSTSEVLALLRSAL